jgi:hypothetical protein
VRWLIVLALALARTAQTSAPLIIDVTVVGRNAASLANLSAVDFQVELDGKVEPVRAAEPRPAAAAAEMTGAVGPVFDAAPMPPSAVYRLSIEVPPGLKPDAAINVSLKRTDLSVLTARRMSVAAAPDAKAAPAATGSIDDRLGDAIARGRAFAAFPLAVGRSIRRAEEPSQVVVDVAVDIPAATPGPISARLGIVDARGAIRTANQMLQADKDGGPYHIDVSLPLAPSTYTLRIAAADANGAVTAVELPVNAQLNRVGSMMASDLLRSAGETDGRRRAITNDTIPSAAMTLFLAVELYPAAERAPPDVLLNLSLTPDGANTPAAERVVTPELRDGMLVAEAEFAVQRLAPGRYVARAIVLSGAHPLGTIEAIVKR